MRDLSLRELQPASVITRSPSASCSAFSNSVFSSLYCFSAALFFCSPWLLIWGACVSPKDRVHWKHKVCMNHKSCTRKHYNAQQWAAGSLSQHKSNKYPSCKTRWIIYYKSLQTLLFFMSNNLKLNKRVYFIPLRFPRSINYSTTTVLIVYCFTNCKIANNRT